MRRAVVCPWGDPTPGSRRAPLNQIEIYFSIVQRKVLQPNDFNDLVVLARTLIEFEHHYNEVAEPFNWTFTRPGLAWRGSIDASRHSDSPRERTTEVDGDRLAPQTFVYRPCLFPKVGTADIDLVVAASEYLPTRDGEDRHTAIQHR